MSGIDFRPIDITHKPKRKQADSILNSGRAFIKEDPTMNLPTAEREPMPLNAITLEKAIKYLDQDTSENAELFKVISMWLKKLSKSRAELKKEIMAEYLQTLKDKKEEIVDTVVTNLQDHAEKLEES